MRKARALAMAALLATALAAGAQQKSPSTVLEPMQAELERSLAALKTQPVPPYFLSYEITESHNLVVSGSYGALSASLENTSRNLDIDIRVGDATLDNTHALRGGGGFSGRWGLIEMPLDNDPAAIRAAIWYNTDSRYKRAVEQLAAVKTNVQIKVEAEDKSADFSAEPPERYVEAPVAVKLDRAKWEDKIRRYSAPFARHADLYDATATLTVTGETRWYVNSEGARVQTSQAYYRLLFSAYTKADDGMELPLVQSFFATTEKGLPDDATVLAAVDKMIADLHTLKNAPVVDPYTGPAILSGRAAGVFFHEIFGHRIEGHRQKQEQESQTFKKMVNQPLLPAFLSVYSDPLQMRVGATELMGSYRFDDQGVRARRVTVVEDGVLKNFLMARSPIDGFPHSNGHGRSQEGFAAVSRQSNLIVASSQRVSRAELKKQLIAMVQKENKPFGLLFDEITGGFTFTGRSNPNAFNVIPEIVYRIYPDGREEMVRGVDLIGTPLTVFSKIVSVDDEVGVFNGVCGAESGQVPVAAVSPGLLVSQIEVQKKEKSQERPPILPAPLAVQE